jgi:hypothetical protein
MRVEAVATTEAEAKAVLSEVRTLLSGWSDRSIGVQGCFEAEDEDESTLDDGAEVAGQTFRLYFAPQ